MAAYPVITGGTTAVEITTANSSLSYTMLLATLYYVAYKVKGLHMEASSYKQLTTNFYYNTVRSDGQNYIVGSSGTIDPDQSQPALDLEVNGDYFILDNLSVVSLTMEPFADLELTFYTEIVNPENKLSQAVKEKTVPVEITKENKIDKKNNTALAITVSALIILTIMYLTVNSNKNE